MPAIVLVRHAQGSFGTADYDVLSETGREQVIAVADALERRGLQVEKVVSGSLRRQLDTAAPIARFAGLEVEVDERWNEYGSDDVLVHHAQTAARLERTDDAPAISSRDFQAILEQALRAWIAAGDGSPAAMTWPQFAAGVRDALAAVADGLGSGGTAVVATSGGPIATVCLSLLDAGDQSLVTFNRVAINTGLTKVAVGRGGMTLVSFNEHGHLEGGDANLLTYR